MAGFIIAIISGALMSLQGVFNTNVTKSSSIWVAAGFVQITAFVTCLVMWFFNGRPEIGGIFRVDNKLSLLGGVIGAFITFTVVKSVSELGIAKAEITIVVARMLNFRWHKTAISVLILKKFMFKVHIIKTSYYSLSFY